MIDESKLDAVFFTATFILLLVPVNSEFFAECEGVQSKTFTGNFKSCRMYIFCNGADSFDGYCNENEYFNAQGGVCEDKLLVDCTIEEGSSASSVLITTENISSQTVKPPLIPPNTTILSSAATTRAPYITTSANAATNGPISSHTEFSHNMEKSTTIFHVSPLDRISTTTLPTAITALECHNMDDPFNVMFLPHDKSCNAYYACINGAPIEMFCSSMLHFNARTGKCDYPEKVKCSLGYMQPHDQCRRHIVDFFPYATNCNYYYLCQDGFLMLEQCPLFYGWDIEKRSCVQLKKARCYS